MGAPGFVVMIPMKRRLVVKLSMTYLTMSSWSSWQLFVVVLALLRLSCDKAFVFLMAD